MARNIGMGPSTPLYRAAITATYTDETQLINDMKRYRANNDTLLRNGMTLTWYEGPYNASGKARSRSTIWSRVYAAKGGSASVECHLEMCEPQWQRLPSTSE
ncbi:hypothetical protein ABR737_01455 [Streptomyces sp. Edi2]|uniref:hypothetical protein n=1 Tax=Streptomyces sp. Edi2 TaxID=3162528 RepID=UPI00330586D6